MTLYYFDTSALVKLYIEEAGSRWVKEIFNSPEKIITFTNIGLVEAASALARRQRMGDISNYQQQVFYTKLLLDTKRQFQLHSITDLILYSAASLSQRHPLRGYDAVHLSTALELNRLLMNKQIPALKFISADDNLCQVAQTEGLITENPNDHR